MPQFTFTKAVKYGAKLRMALIGASGSGKTYSSLSIARYLGSRIAFIDTERGSARKYSDVFDFDVLELESFSAENFISAIQAAEKGGYDVLIIDSLSHAWSGKDGILEYVDERTAASRAKNAYTSGWRDATPLHNRLVDAILTANMHVIACMRSKVEYVLQDDGHGKKVPTKIGMQPVQREGMEYEFDVLGDLDMDHNFIISKTRCAALDKRVFNLPGENVASILNAWLTGAAAPAQISAPTPTGTATAPAPQSAPVPVSNSRETEIKELLKKRISSMMSQNLNEYGSIDKVKGDIKAALGVNKLDDCHNVKSMEAFYASLGKIISVSETPFSHTPVEIKAGPNQEEVDAKVQAFNTEADRRDVNNSVLATLMRSVDEAVARGDISMIDTLILSVQGYPVKAALVPEEVKELRAKIHDQVKILVAHSIDGFDKSIRLTNSVKDHLGVKKIDECTDPEALRDYVAHLATIIQQHQGEVA